MTALDELIETEIQIRQLQARALDLRAKIENPNGQPPSRAASRTQEDSLDPRDAASSGRPDAESKPEALEGCKTGGGGSLTIGILSVTESSTGSMIFGATTLHARPSRMYLMSPIKLMVFGRSILAKLFKIRARVCGLTTSGGSYRKGHES
jgi:hypothetical protein